MVPGIPTGNFPPNTYDQVIPSVAAPAAGGATVVLFNSVTSFGPRQMRARLLAGVELTWIGLDQASAASGLKAYASVDGGSNWYEVSMPDDTGVDSMPKTVAALAVGKNNNYRFIVSNYDDFKIEYTAGVAAPAVWRLITVLHYGTTAGL